jgi:hypothetical protein
MKDVIHAIAMLMIVQDILDIFLFLSQYFMLDILKIVLKYYEKYVKSVIVY